MRQIQHKDISSYTENTNVFGLVQFKQYGDYFEMRFNAKVNEVECTGTSSEPGYPDEYIIDLDINVTDIELDKTSESGKFISSYPLTIHQFNDLKYWIHEIIKSE